ncbi:mitotic-spindle organizing protein 1 [Grus japonensis]|uniref:Mitotic-spindle organizing protein 1 n=1 Tax=Grus japonensis TaxID=30415 RepID=A0ABC9W292_GRUJA
MASNAASLNAVRETMDGPLQERCSSPLISFVASSGLTPAVLFEISRILNTGLDMETLSICVRLCEQGINPEALSSVIKELRKATEALKAAENMTG